MPIGSIAAKDNLTDLHLSKWLVHFGFHMTAIGAILNIGAKSVVVLLVMISTVADGINLGGPVAVCDIPPPIGNLVDDFVGLEKSGERFNLSNNYRFLCISLF